jgi:hypothetical protein
MPCGQGAARRLSSGSSGSGSGAWGRRRLCTLAARSSESQAGAQQSAALPA